ncbi:hypothetical protein ACIQW4_05620 [Streptomyces albogriseolus]|uniref:hypothetical protein n=1 Tax=Streptomyces albogriseolus TaxID=1887 RepID=UPI003830D26A
MTPDLSDTIARLDVDDLAVLADVLPGLKWGGSDTAAALLALVVEAQEAHEQGSPISRPGA